MFGGCDGTGKSFPLFFFPDILKTLTAGGNPAGSFFVPATIILRMSGLGS